jgi:hypothetical protein
MHFLKLAATAPCLLERDFSSFRRIHIDEIGIYQELSQLQLKPWGYNDAE